MIQTVNGKIAANELGITMSHEHLCVDLSRIRKNQDSTFGYESIVIDEIEEAKKYNVNTFVEVSCNDMGRNPLELKKLADRCGIHIIASTGFYLDSYHPEEIRTMPAEKIAEIFIDDLTVGMNGTSIKAGVIGEVASSKIMTPNERKVLQAAAIAARQVGCAVITHCQMGSLGNEQAEIFINEKVNPDKVILGHIDLSDDMEYMCGLIDKGFNIAFDTIGKEQFLKDSKRAENICQLIEKGYVDKIVISQDISKKSYFHNEQGCLGYSTVMKKFIPMLENLGVSKSDISKMLIYNPQRIFDIA